MHYQRDMLIGRWYRDDLSPQGFQQSEYAELSADGSFELTFVTLNESGEVTEQTVELGDWGLVGDIHFTITKGEFVLDKNYPADLADPDNYHAYRILKLDNQIFEYQHVVTKEVFILRRVINKTGHC
ncbi:MAG: hypothetical protein HRT37_09605 [Alteromonadaceae bacterium]|nr:hypothetical protein [Alteromonadaceae bacterium]